MSDLIIGQIDNDMVIGHQIAITSDEIIIHVDVFSVIELPYSHLKKPLAPIILILAINETSGTLVLVSDDVNQTIVIISASSEKVCLQQFLLGRIMFVDIGDLPMLAISIQ